MAPVRRYLRISKYSVLECRIYLDNPALAQSWLLHPRHNILPRVIESIRPLVLPKLREERDRDRGKKKSSKKKVVKDVIVKDDFEVSMFLTETNTRHSLLSKHKHFREKMPGRMQSNSSKLIAETSGEPVNVEDDMGDTAPVLREEDSDEDAVALGDIPAAAAPREDAKRERSSTAAVAASGQDSVSAIELGSDSDADADAPPPKRLRRPRGQRGRQGSNVDDVEDSDAEGEEENDDKKKLAMDVSYEGFAIYGRVLCLVVKKKEANKPAQSKLAASGAGQAQMENWITSTQIPVGEDI